MRIGIDATSWLNRRGFGRFVRELLSALACLDTRNEYVLLADQQTAECDDLPKDWHLSVAKTSVAAAEAAAADGRRSIADMLAMRKLVAREPLDLIFFPAVYSYFPVGGRIPCLVTFHDVIAETLPKLVFDNRRSRFFWNLKSKLAVRRSAKIVTVSEASKLGLMEHFRLPSERVRVITEAPSEVFCPIECSGTEHEQILSKYGVETNGRFLLSVGGISPHKNLDTLIRAHAKLVRDADNADIELLFVGDYKGDNFRTCHAELADLSKQLGSQERVRFLGFVPDDDLAHLYAVTQAFVFPSFLEGFGLPAVEAMACGAPVIASDRGSLPEVLNGAGVLFDPFDADTLATAIHRVLGDKVLQNDLRSRSLGRAKEFSWEASARQLAGIFGEFDR